MSRPPRSIKAADEVVPVRLTTNEKALIQGAASIVGASLSAFVRDAALLSALAVPRAGIDRKYKR